MDDYLAISALQHYAFCPRQFALIHIEKAWEENHFTAEGKILHQRVDSHESEQRGNLRYERSVSLLSERYKLIGKMDLLEIEAGDPPRYFPIEYKRGKPKVEDWDRIQLCAQALCLEEMRNTQVLTGAIWYWEIHRREPVLINEALRAVTINSIEQSVRLRDAGVTPKPTDIKSRCRACSIKELCQPDSFRDDRTAKYIEGIDT